MTFDSLLRITRGAFFIGGLSRRLRWLVVTCLVVSFGAGMKAELVTHTWPKSAGEAIGSDRYEVYVTLGSGAEKKLDVLMSKAIFEGDYAAKELEGRTFSFASLDYQPADGPLKFRVVKKFGRASKTAEIAPRSYGIVAKTTGDKEVSFSVDAHSRYFSINFRGADNETNERRWIRHMLCVFIDPPEISRPDPAAPGVVLYHPGANTASLSSAATIYFAPGYHNLRKHQGGAPIEDGILKLRPNQSVYLASGAFVDGLINTTARNDPRQKLYGRGILSGRLFPWLKKPGYRGPNYREMVRLGVESTVEGITMLEAPTHGLVASGRTAVSHFKLIGWHGNNDGIRVGSGSEIKHSFVRAVDDHFQNFNIWVHDCVLWPGHNGAVLTFGWGGEDRPTYNAGSSLFENIDVINPEWMHLGNNNGLVAAQTGLDYKPFGYGGETLTVLRNIRVEGAIPGIVNLKPHSTSRGVVDAVKVPSVRLGYLGDLSLENIEVDRQFAKGLMKGAQQATTTGEGTYFTQNIRFTNVRIGGQLLTAANADQFFEIEASTTREILFSAASGSLKSQQK